ncbi:TraM recognition domain-containing protein, partial [Vibrio metschnikovii]|nr:TraM recognition domain-containing protein [Vibrio metschnikovii]
GLDESRKPLYIERPTFEETNVQICGSMGSGKGVQAQILLSQLIKQGDAVVTFDPKFDDYLPHVLKRACEQNGKPFFFFNLRENTPQISPFFGTNEHEIAEIFIAAFDLEDRGTDADVYKVSARKSAQKIAQYLVSNELYISQIPSHLDLILNADELKFSKAFIEKIETISKVVALQTSSGSELIDVIKQGGCAYIVGDDVGVIQDAQKMLLVRVLQLIKNIPVHERCFVSIFADEVKALLCPLLVNQSGQLRARRANLIYAHQSDADLSVIGSNFAEILKDNSALSWFYKQKRYEAALEVAQMTGTKKAQTSTYTTENNHLGMEIRASDERRSVETQTYFIDTNVIQTLPKRSAVLIGDGLAKIGFCSPISVDNKKILHVHQAPRLDVNNSDDAVLHEAGSARSNAKSAPDFLDVLNEQ